MLNLRDLIFSQSQLLDYCDDEINEEVTESHTKSKSSFKSNISQNVPKRTTKVSFELPKNKRYSNEIDVLDKIDSDEEEVEDDDVYEDEFYENEFNSKNNDHSFLNQSFNKTDPFNKNSPEVFFATFVFLFNND